MNKIDVRLETPEIKVDYAGGIPGQSAYEIWLLAGNEGTVEQFLESLRGAGAETYIYEQIRASEEWTITHYLNKYPSVTIVDTGNNVIIGAVEYLDKDRLILRFNFEFSGFAYLN